MHVGQLLHFQSTFQAGRKTVTSAHNEERPLLIELLSNTFNLVIQG